MRSRSWLAQGFTLIELVIFILVVSLLATSMYLAFFNALKAAPHAAAFSKAADLAQERMELIFAQRRQTTFANFTAANFDPCSSSPPSSQPPCTNIPPAYTVSATLQANWNGNTNFKIISVTVNGGGVFTLQSLVANY